MSLADFFKRKPNSGDVAKGRLKLVLVSDRANCSPDIMEQIKNDIINVLTKYIEIDLEGLDIKISQTESEGNNGTVPALFANIPIKDMKSKSEVKSEIKSEIKNKESRKETINDSKNVDKSDKKEITKEKDHSNTQTSDTSKKKDDVSKRIHNN